MTAHKPFFCNQPKAIPGENYVCFGGRGVMASVEGGMWSIPSEIDLRELSEEELAAFVEEEIRKAQS